VGGEQDLELLERRGDGRAPVSGERLQQLAGGREQVPAHRARTPASGLGEGQDHRASVLRIVLALDEPGLGKGGREARDDRRGDDKVARDLGLWLRPVVSIRRMTLYC
jgi:hypothetical protein